MQSPVIIFDHVNKVVTVAHQGSGDDKKVEEVLAAQRDQVTTAGGRPPH